MLQQVEDSKFSVEESTRPSASNPAEKVLSLSHVSKHTHREREREREMMIIPLIAGKENKFLNFIDIIYPRNIQR